MKLASGEIIQAPIFQSGHLSSQTLRLKVGEQVGKYPEFSLYQGENSDGMHLLLKVMKYSSEQLSKFNTLKEYVEHKRQQLHQEHKLLCLENSCLPEPLAMLCVENTCQEDEKLFQGSEWSQLKSNEPVLVMEYFAGKPLCQQSDDVRSYTLQQKVSVVRRLARLCQFFHEHGYVVQDLCPQNIIASLDKDDNLYLANLTNACSMKNGKLDKNHFNYGKAFGLNSTEEWDSRVDIYQLGILFYYLVMPEDFAKDSQSFSKPKAKKLEKAIGNLKTSATWLTDIILQMLNTLPAMRLPDIDTFLDYLGHPPKDPLEYKIISATSQRIELQLLSYTNWMEKICWRLEKEGEVLVQDTAPQEYLELPGIGVGQVFCTLIAYDRKKRQTRWHTIECSILPEVNLTTLEEIPADHLGLKWDITPEFKYVEVMVHPTEGKAFSLGKFTENHLDISMRPHLDQVGQKSFLVVCNFTFLIGKELQVLKKEQRAKIYDPIPTPEWEPQEDGICVKLVEQYEKTTNYKKIELLQDNRILSVTKKTKKKRGNEQSYLFYLPSGQMDVLQPHEYQFRIYLKSAGWRVSEPVVISPDRPCIQNLRLVEEKPGWFRVNWNDIRHPQLEGYEIHLDNSVVGRSRFPSYLVGVPISTLLEKKGKEINLEVFCIYLNGAEQEKLSAPASVTIPSKNIQELYKCDVQEAISPSKVEFHIQIENFEVFEAYSSDVEFTRWEKDSPENKTIQKIQLEPELHLVDEKIESEKKYHYQLQIPELQLCLMEKTIEISKVRADVQLEEVSYEKCTWKIQLNDSLQSMMSGDINLIRHLEEQIEERNISWSSEKKQDSITDTNLVPGKTYEYFLRIPLNNKTFYEKNLGSITTGVFPLEESIDTSYHRALISWTPLPENHIEAVELYDEGNRLVGETRSDRITLENLEPERTYHFPLKYRYQSGTSYSGKTLSFTMDSYEIPAEAVDIAVDSFRLKWDVPDTKIAKKLKEFRLQVSDDVGEHKLRSKTRSVHLRQLSPFISYDWKILGTFRSGSTCTLVTGKTQTIPPEFHCDIEVGLVHHITWSYTACSSIEKIEVQRDGIPLIETTENELYDSDFKGSGEVLYQFYYILGNGRKELAAEKSAKPLTIASLYKSLQIQPGIGTLQWDFSGLRQFEHLKYVELLQEDQCLYKQGSHTSSLVFEDAGEQDYNNQLIGMSNEPANYKVAVVGVAPSKRKCKKKWVLNIKGIQCYYPDLPTGFQFTPEYSCIYFSWEQTPTDFLEKIILRRDDGLIIYEGENQGCILYDDNQGEGLVTEQSYTYEIEMIYHKHRSVQYIDVELNSDFDPSRFQIDAEMRERNLLIHWNKDLDTSITNVGCRIIKNWWNQSIIFSQLFTSAHWADFTDGHVKIPIADKREVKYQVVFQDYYGNVFQTEPQSASYKMQKLNSNG